MTGGIASYTAGRNADAVALMHVFRDAVLALGEVEERVHASEIAWARRRVFAAAFIHGRKLEVAIDLLREVSHRTLREAFPTTRRVITHRFSLVVPADFDAGMKGWLREAWETVGPGTRRSGA